MKCDYIKVVVIPGTFNIVSMYPINLIEASSIKNLECDYNKLFNKNEYKVKKICAIDKFNKRYGTNY